MHARARSWSFGDMGQGRYASISTALTFYNSALYFAAMTASSIGYGDISASSNSDFEKGIVSVFMLLTALVWAYIVGNLVDALSGPDRWFRAKGLSSLMQSCRHMTTSLLTRITCRHMLTCPRSCDCLAVAASTTKTETL